MDSTDFEDFMDFFWIFSGFFDEVYGIFGVKCPSGRSNPFGFHQHLLARNNTRKLTDKRSSRSSRQVLFEL
jgi:hypothetical protein